MNLYELQNEISKLSEQRSKYILELQTYKDNKQILSKTVENEQTSIEHMEGTIDSLQVTLFELNKLLEKHEEELTNITSIVEEMSKSLSEKDQQIAEKREQLVQLQNEALCKKALSANQENCFFASLKRTTSTTPIVTKFCESNKEFMILDCDMKLPSNIKFSYIIVPSNKRIKESQKNVPTMSELKSVASKAISSVNIPRMQYLKEHILAVANNCKELSAGLILPLSEPCQVGGQADFDQSGYGWEWDWTYGLGSCTEGTYYGEMTGFFVVGIKINKANYY